MGIKETSKKEEKLLCAEEGGPAMTLIASTASEKANPSVGKSFNEEGKLSPVKEELENEGRFPAVKEDKIKETPKKEDNLRCTGEGGPVMTASAENANPSGGKSLDEEGKLSPVKEKLDNEIKFSVVKENKITLIKETPQKEENHLSAREGPVKNEKLPHVIENIEEEDLEGDIEKNEKIPLNEKKLPLNTAKDFEKEDEVTSEKAEASQSASADVEKPSSMMENFELHISVKWDFNRDKEDFDKNKENLDKELHTSVKEDFDKEVEKMLSVKEDLGKEVKISPKEKRESENEEKIF